MHVTADDDDVLHFLSDLPLHLAPGDDIRGKTMHDSSGKVLGHINDFVVSHDNARILFAQVEQRSLLSHRKYLIPIDDIEIRGANGIYVRGDAQDAGATPWHCPELVN